MTLTVSKHSFLTRASMAVTKLCLVSLCLVVMSGFGAPLDAAKAKVGQEGMEDLRERLRQIRDLPGLNKEEYMRYWQEMAKNDPNQFDHLKKIGDLHHGADKANLERLIEQNPLLGERLAKNSDNIRSRLEEAKRMNVEQMRQLQRLQMLREDHVLKDGDWNTKLEALREKLPPKFSDDDIQARIKEQNKILEQIDAERRTEFKKAEMHAEHRRRELLKAMDEKKRLKAEEDYEKKQNKLRHHEKLHHPGSEQQLEDVWENEDGLDRDGFNPKTFFHLHDKNSDRHLDAMEWESLFYNELGKVYGDDMGGMEAHEDLARMREHVITEMDKDGDGLVSLEEFLVYSKDPEFKQDDEWKSVAEEDNFDDKDFEKYEENYDDYYDYEYDENGNLIGYKTKQKGMETEEDSMDRMPDHHDTPNEQGDHDNQEGHPPNQDLPNEGEKEDRGLPPEINKVPQIDDPNAVHFNAAAELDKNPDQGVPDKVNEQVPQQNTNEV